MSFDRLEAHYWYAVDYHGGQDSRLYKHLCKLSRYYHPSPIHKGFANLTIEGRFIYNTLAIRRIGQ